MHSSELRVVVIDWLDDNYHFGDAAALVTDDDMSFLEHGILTSIGFVELIAYLEDTLGIRIDPADLSRDNFDGMNKIVTYVTAVLAGTPS